MNENLQKLHNKGGAIVEFRLNKIDTNLRQLVNDATKEGKVHSKQAITVNKDKDQEKGQEEKKKEKNSKEKFNLSKYSGIGRKIIVEAVKIENVEVEATKDEAAASENTYKGRFIDFRK